jgi:hypothetical protein
MYIYPYMAMDVLIEAGLSIPFRFIYTSSSFHTSVHVGYYIGWSPAEEVSNEVNKMDPIIMIKSHHVH